MLGSSVSAAEYEIDEKLTSVAALDGKLFAIVDETDLKAFCFGYGENGWDMFYKAYNDGDAQSAKLIRLLALFMNNHGQGAVISIRSLPMDLERGVALILA